VIYPYFFVLKSAQNFKKSSYAFPFYKDFHKVREKNVSSVLSPEKEDIKLNFGGLNFKAFFAQNNFGMLHS